MCHLFPGYSADMTDVPWLDDREQRAWRGLQFMQLRLDAVLSRELAGESAMSYSDYVVLVALTDRPDGRLRLFELAHVLGWERSRLSHHVARMVSRGLVVKEPHSDDRRGAFVVVSDEGRRQIDAAAPGHVAAVRRVFLDVVTPTQLDVIADVAEAVLARLDRQDALSD